MTKEFKKLKTEIETLKTAVDNAKRCMHGIRLALYKADTAAQAKYRGNCDKTLSAMCTELIQNMSETVDDIRFNLLIQAFNETNELLKHEEYLEKILSLIPSDKKESAQNE